MTTSPSTWDFDTLDAASSLSADEALAQGGTANAMVAQALAESVGPAPTIPAPEDPFVPLPGGVYRDDAWIRQAQVRELTGEDEEALAAVTGSLANWMSVLLERGLVRLGDQAATSRDVRGLLIGDRDALMLAIRIATFGPDITVQGIVCPHCDESMDATIDLRTVDQVVLDTPQPRHEYEIPLRHGRTAIASLPTGATQERIFAEDAGNVAERNTRLLGDCLERVTAADGAVVDKKGTALAKSLSMADRATILRYLAEHQPGPKLDRIAFVHEGCGQEVRLALTLPEIFRL